MTTKIPKSVLAMLARIWPHRDATYNEPLSDFDHFKTIKIEYPHPSRGKRFSAAHDEARSLVDDGVLVNLSDDDVTIVIDYQERAALEFFCAQIYLSWAEYQSRVKRWRLLRDQAEHRKRWAAKQDMLISRQDQILTCISSTSSIRN